MGGIGAPVAGNRTRVSKKRLTGQLVQWRGKYGWIRPTEPVNHPDAGRHGGKVYIGIEDIEGPELTNKCMVSFAVYLDDTGLGAMQCRRAPGQEKPAKGAGGKGGVIKTNLKQSNGRTAGPVGGKPQPKKAKGAGKGGKKNAVKAELEEGEERGPPPAPDKNARERLMPQRIVGKLIRWKGTIGWIRPHEKIEHPEVPKNKRDIYLHEVDVQPGHELFQGAQVKFFIYSDADGVGAEHCMLTKEQPPPDEKPEKPSLKAKAKAKGKGKGEAGAKKPTMVEKMKLKRRRHRRRGDKEKKGDGEKKEGGPDLPRERLTDVPVTGEVADWKGKFGWLSLADPSAVEHEMASRHDGKIYIHEQDILDGAPLKVGQTVEFHVYADKSGLGAEEAIATLS